MIKKIFSPLTIPFGFFAILSSTMANAVFIVESAPSVVPPRADLHIGGTVDFWTDPISAHGSASAGVVEARRGHQINDGFIAAGRSTSEVTFGDWNLWVCEWPGAAFVIECGGEPDPFILPPNAVDIAWSFARMTAPLPAAVFLLMSALAGLVGVVRFARKQ